MTPSIEQLTALERRMTIPVPLAEIDRQVATRLRRLAQTVRMPGFRPGKVPLKIIAQQYEPQVRGEVIGDAVQKAFNDAVQDQKLRVAGAPKIERKEGEPAPDQLEFNAVFEVYPEVKVGDIGAARVEQETIAITDNEVDRTIESLRKQRATYVEVARPAQAGDRVTVDFVAKIDGNEFPGGTGQGMQFILGEKRALPEFEANVAGMSAAETKRFDVTFPADYGGREVAGKTAAFEVTLTRVEEVRLPEVNEDLAKALGIEDGNLERMRVEVRENVEREARSRVATRTKQRVMQALLDSTSVEVPKALVEMEQDRLAENARKDLAARGLKNVESIPLDREIFREQATRRVKLGLIIAQLVQEHSLAAKPDQVRKLVEDYARTYEQPFEVIRWIYSQRDRLAEFEGLAVEDNVVQWVLSKAQVQEKAVDFNELMGSTA